MAIPRFRLDGLRRHKLLTAADARRLPPIRSQDGKGDDAIAFVKFFTPGSRFTFYVTEFDGKDELFGYTISPLGPDCDAWGYSSLRELAELAFPTGTPMVERDESFVPTTIGKCKEEHEPPRPASGVEIHMVVWEHRHGVDISAHSSEELARKHVAEIARKWWSEAREREPRSSLEPLPEAPPEDDWEAIQLYFSARDGDESVSISPSAVDAGGLVFFEACTVTAERIHYVPFVGPDGRVGYAIRGKDDQEEFFYLNPSQAGDDGDARTIFVYQGDSNDPAEDGPLHHYPVAGWHDRVGAA